MAAKHSSALRTPPLRILALHKSGRRMPLDKSEVFDDARVVMLMIPRVDSLQVTAREIAAFKTKTDLIIPKEIAAFLKRAFLISRETSCAIRYAHLLAFYIVFARKVPAAHRAVYAARRYELCIIVHFLRIENSRGASKLLYTSAFIHK